MGFNQEKPAQSVVIQKPTGLLCEYTVDPIGIDVIHPRFSWTLRHSERGQKQSAYQILVARTREKLVEDIGDFWDTGKVQSKKSVNVEYQGTRLETGKAYYWKVRWWDDEGRVSPYSDVATFEMGLLSEDDCKAKWIKGGDLLRTTFDIDREAKRARAYICGLGYYELRINGKRVGDHQLDPGWTDYEKSVLYSTYDVTEILSKGENAVGVMLGKGRYIRDVPRSAPPNVADFVKLYEHACPKLILQINLEFLNGTEEIIVSDETWKVAKGPIVENDIYDGETYDARLEKEGWDLPGYDDSSWATATLAVPPCGTLVSQATFPKIEAVKTIPPLSIRNPKPGVYVYDFGQNFSGWVRLTVNGPRGTKVKLRTAELLHRDGMINPTPNRQAKSEDTYILKGKEVEVYEPRFTYHGFRYVELTGFPGTPRLDSLLGIAVHSAVQPVGGFMCSNELINSIHRTVLWTQLSNLMSIPTDCPQRSERMGWLGDAQLTVEEAMYNFNMAGFYSKWIRDIKEAQKEDGSIPDVAPAYWKFYPADPAWGTACITIPWYQYVFYDDEKILKTNYELMKGWIEFLGSRAEGCILYSKYGDWCPPGQVRSLATPGELVSTWYYYHDSSLLSKIAQVLGKAADAEKYAQLSEEVKEAFNKAFLKGDHYSFSGETVKSSSQTSNLLPLYLDMVPEDKKEAVLSKLLLDVEGTHDSHVGTGIVGTRYILDTLTKYGRCDLAYKILTQTTYPSWGYMIKEGATTLWERWEYLAGAGMNSHNHIMLGSVDCWFYKILAGINPDLSAPGFEKIIIKPQIVGDLTHVAASVNTIRGLVSSSWRKEGNTLILEVTLPVNSEGKVSVPTMGLEKPVVKESGKTVWKDGSYVQGVLGITSGKQDEEHITFNVGPGTYSFWIEETS